MKVEPCSNPLWPARRIWKSPRRSCESPWRRKVRRTARAPSRRSARNSTKRKPSFQVPDCACITRFGRLLDAKSGHFD